jgi:hypothetical protein
MKCINKVTDEEIRIKLAQAKKQYGWEDVTYSINLFVHDDAKDYKTIASIHIQDMKTDNIVSVSIGSVKSNE